MSSESTNIHSNRGYLAAFGSTLFLALTAIFIRYLTVNYQIPALILTFWREFFVAFFLLIFFLLFKPVLLKGARPTCLTSRSMGWCWLSSTAHGRFQWH